MNTKAMKELRDNSRLIYGMLNVLKDDVDSLRYDANNGDIFNLLISSRNTKQTIERIKDLIDEIEYILFVNAI